MSGAFLLYVWGVTATCTCLYVWLKKNFFLAVLLAIAWLMVAFVGGLIA